MQNFSNQEVAINFSAEQNSLVVDLSVIENPTLARLVNEIKNDEGTTMGSYDRAHNRHNR